MVEAEQQQQHAKVIRKPQVPRDCNTTELNVLEEDEESFTFDLFTRGTLKTKILIDTVLMFIQDEASCTHTDTLFWSTDADMRTRLHDYTCATHCMHARIHSQAARTLLPPTRSMLTLFYRSWDLCSEVHFMKKRELLFSTAGVM